MRRHSAGALAFVALLLAAQAAAAQSDREGTLEHQGLTRRYTLHLPPGAPEPESRRLVVALHGLDEDGDSERAVTWFRAWWTMDAVADREGFAVVYPAAIGGRWSYSSQRPVPIPGQTELVDDIGFVGALIDRLVADRIADPAWIFVTGPSRGGLMTWSMACSMSERIAAAAPLITGMTDGQVDMCHPTHFVPLLALAGTADRSQPYEGWLYQRLPPHVLAGDDGGLAPSSQLHRRGGAWLTAPRGDRPDARGADHVDRLHHGWTSAAPPSPGGRSSVADPGSRR